MGQIELAGHKDTEAKCEIEMAVLDKCYKIAKTPSFDVMSNYGRQKKRAQFPCTSLTQAGKQTVRTKALFSLFILLSLIKNLVPIDRSMCVCQTKVKFCFTSAMNCVRPWCTAACAPLALAHYDCHSL